MFQTKLDVLLVHLYDCRHEWANPEEASKEVFIIYGNFGGSSGTSSSVAPALVAQ